MNKKRVKLLNGLEILKGPTVQCYNVTPNPGVQIAKSERNCISKSSRLLLDNNAILFTAARQAVLDNNTILFSSAIQAICSIVGGGILFPYLLSSPRELCFFSLDISKPVLEVQARWRTGNDIILHMICLNEKMMCETMLNSLHSSCY
ncbi:hypothetical protein BVC80_8105g3 [Macleaya cordata]|uniref:Uncharacterized protein n=1 Tax=Macleaya cordata TaxID=56857 RepID=A0A200QG51_MACCD|nr:hypothetical protein BVC80_8105g3 [Macleaya cordata]